ncbi:MAG: UDP-N-acetylmuramate--alanine ligase [Hyphomonadaceae bacterium]|nr:UDP-N-acetylmuramate--alanine ligase [Hyphomonadaceae bacterium]
MGKRYFFCGIGGSGMLPLALIVQARGGTVEGSDRSLDAGRTAKKFEFLRARGIRLFAQDGSGVVDGGQIVVASAAVEETVPDVVSARRVGATMLTRAQLLSSLFNESGCAVGVAGTSGKSTTTGMLGWILSVAGLKPTVMNGGVMKNFITEDVPFASAVVGEGAFFVSEVDESDGSIAQFNPKVALLNNIALDHKSLEELRRLFGDFCARAEVAVLNMDNAEVARLAETLPATKRMSYAVNGPADVTASALAPAPGGISFDLFVHARAIGRVELQTPGLYNVSNALAAIAGAMACGVAPEEAAAALKSFAGIQRRMDMVGSANGIVVIDDFAHNPDKIAATLAALKTFPGRVLVMFQPSGFGSLNLTKNELIATFANGLGAEDVLFMSEPPYFGGTVNRVVSSAEIVEGVRAGAKQGFAFADRAACAERIVEMAAPGDRIIVMGARDDTLSQYAAELLARVRANAVEALIRGDGEPVRNGDRGAA